MCCFNSLRYVCGVSALALMAFAMTPAMAKVSSQEAAKLKTVLTPLGGERAANADGTIPAWTGEAIPDPDYKPGGRRDTLFKGDKPLFTINAANEAKYADKLSEGTKAMLAKYPDSFRLDVYKTVRSAMAPQWVYDNTYKNALNAELVDSAAGPYPRHAFGGLPFPIPQNGTEAIWNHVLSWRGVTFQFPSENILVTADGKRVTLSDLSAEGALWQLPYYFKEGNADQFDVGNGVHTQFLLQYSGPPIRAGESLLGNFNFDGAKDMAWIYLTGQRRTRKLPTPCCDTPSPATAGVMSIDEVFVFQGRLDRFDWKLVGTQELYVPYNTNQLLAPTNDDDVVGAHHLNPDHVRWELHRVKVVEATLVSGKRHINPKSRYYIDEDSGWALLGERWDSSGGLWKNLFNLPLAMPDMPGIAAQTFGYNDLVSGTSFVGGIMNRKNSHRPLVDRISDTVFTPEGLSGTGVR